MTRASNWLSLILFRKKISPFFILYSRHRELVYLLQDKGILDLITLELLKYSTVFLSKISAISENIASLIIHLLFIRSLHSSAGK